MPSDVRFPSQYCIHDRAAAAYMAAAHSVLNGYYQGAGGQVPGSRDPISEIVCSYDVPYVYLEALL